MKILKHSTFSIQRPTPKDAYWRLSSMLNLEGWALNVYLLFNCEDSR